jgi:hypothetical protein
MQDEEHRAYLKDLREREARQEARHNTPEALKMSRAERRRARSR